MNGSFSKPKLVQVGLVVRDLDKTMQQFKLLLGAEPDRVDRKIPLGPGSEVLSWTGARFLPARRAVQHERHRV